MLRALVSCLALSGALTAVAADGPRMVTLSVTIATGSDAKLSLNHDGPALAATLAELEQQQTLSHLARVKFSLLEEQQAQFQYGETTSVITGRSMTFGGSSLGGSRGSTPGTPPDRGAPVSSPMYQQQQTGTLVQATTRVTDAGVIAEISLEQSRFDRSKPAGDEPQVTPPAKPLVSVRSTVVIPKDQTVVLGGFERTEAGATERTVVLVSATVSTQPAAAVKAEVAPQLKIFSLQHVQSDAVRDTLQQLLSDRDYRFAVDARSNSLLVQATPDAMDVVAAILQRLDEPVKRDHSKQ